VREALQRLKGEGLEVVLDGDDLVVRAPGPLNDELLSLLREHKAEFVSALRAARQHSACRETTSAGAACAQLHVCGSCTHFEPRPHIRPNGWCRQFCIETWSKMPLGARYVVGRQ
jgi:hypothetical protein